MTQSRNPSLTDLRNLAKQGKLYHVTKKAVAMDGTKSTYQRYREHAEEGYDHGDFETFGKVKPEELHFLGRVIIRVYRGLYFVIERNYRWMQVYSTRELN